MLVTIKNVLGPEQIRQCRQALSAAAWTDGRATAGHQAVQVKQNRQLAPDDPLTLRLEKVVLDALGNNPQFIAAALPLKVFPPMFNRYEGGGRYGNHIDSSVLSVPGTPHRVRTDISATLFFSEPPKKEGGDEKAQVCGWLKDKDGLSWQVCPVNWEELTGKPGAFKKLMGMKKIVIAEFEDN